MDVTQLALTWVGWPNSEKLASTCVQIWSRPKWAQAIASQHKFTQVLESQVDASSQLASTCASVWPGLYVIEFNSRNADDFSPIVSEHLQSNTILIHRGLWITIWEQQQENWKNLPRKEMSPAQISDLSHVCFNRNWRPKRAVCSIMPCESLFTKRNYTERNLYLIVYVKFVNEAAIDKHPKWSLQHLVWLQWEIIKLKTIHFEFISLRYRRVLNSKNRKDISASWLEIEILPPKQMNANSTVCFENSQSWDNNLPSLVLIL